VTVWPLPLTFWHWHCFAYYCASHPRLTHRFLLSCGYRLLNYMN